MNDAPQLTPAPTPVSYAEQAAPTPRMQSLTVNDADMPSEFSGGSLQVQITFGFISGDGIVLLPGSGFTSSGSNPEQLFRGADLVGTIAGLGTGFVSVTAFSSAVTPVVANELVKAFGFQSASDNPGFGDRAVRFLFNDGGHTGNGTPTAAVQQLAHVAPVNDAPALSQHANTISYTENGAPLRLLPSVTVADPDNPASFSGGTITAVLSAPKPGDELVFASGSGVTLSGNQVVVDDFVVGTLTTSGSGTNLSIALSADATLARVNTVLEALAYHSTSENPDSSDRTATVSFNDGGNTGASATPTDVATVTIHVSPVNDAPVSGGVASASGGEDAASIGGTVPAASDVDDTALTYALVAGSVKIDGVAAADGTVTFGSNGAFSYTPVAADHGLDTGKSKVISFDYVATDGEANSAPATVTVTVNGVNDETASYAISDA